MSDLRGLCQQLFGEIGAETFEAKHLELDQQIRESIARFSGVKTDVFPMSFSDELDIRISVLLSDFTSVFMTGGKQMAFCIRAKDATGWPKQIRMTVELLHAIGVRVAENGIPVIHPALAYSEGTEASSYFQQLRPLVEAGRVMIRPRPVFLALSEDEKPSSGKNWKVLETDPNLPGDTWVCRGSTQEETSIPLESADLSRSSFSEIGTAILPFLDGVPFADLAKILDDESDSLATFRRDIRETIRKSQEEPGASTDVFNDVLRPAAEKVQRDFQAIRNKYLSRVSAATVGAVVLSLGVATGIELSTAAAMTSGAAAALGLVTKEYTDYRESLSKLKDLPHYLLWRIKRRVV